MADRAIGIFDSGVGGLTVLKELINILPNEKIIYFGDTARTPYGNKSKQTILSFSREIINFLISHEIKLLIIACNTVSANCYQDLKQEFNIPMVEVLSSGVNKSLEATRNKKIGIIGTEATINSGEYEKKILLKAPDAKIFSKACPLFVPLAEEGWVNNKIAYDIARIYLEEFKNKIDTLVLACTHYPLFDTCLKNILPDIKIINPAQHTALEAKKFLVKKKLLNLNKNSSSIVFFTSDNSDKFKAITKMILQKEYPDENFYRKYA